MAIGMRRVFQSERLERNRSRSSSDRRKSGRQGSKFVLDTFPVRVLTD